MKKFFLLLVGLLALISCEQEEFGDFVKSDTKQAQTRSVNSIVDFNPIDEIADIPVNILNVGNTGSGRLSCVKSGTKVDLYGRDDGSGRQQWNIKYGRSIVLTKGNNAIASDKYLVVAPNNWPSIGAVTVPTGVKLYSIVRDDSSTGIMNLPGFIFESINNNYLIKIWSGSFPLTSYYLKSESPTSSSLNFGTDKSSLLAQWHLIFTGQYELVDLQYVMTPEDKFIPTRLVYDRDEYINYSNSVQTWHYSVKTSVTQSSNYSEAQGFSISYTQGTTVGLPNLSGDGGNVTVNNTIQQQSSRTWNFGNNKSITTESNRTGDIPVQPGETISLDAELTIYKGSLTYVATLRKVGDTKTFRVKGKWEGECYSKFRAKTYSSSGEFLKDYDLQ